MRNRTGNGNEKRKVVLGSSPRLPNEYVTSQGRLGTRLLNGYIDNRPTEKGLEMGKIFT